MTLPNKPTKQSVAPKAEVPPTFEHPQPQTTVPSNFQEQNQNPDLDFLTSEVQRLALLVDSLVKSKKNEVTGHHINLNTDVVGMFEVVSAAPTATPSNVYGQVKIYVNSTTYRLYWYDWNAHVWHYVTATA